jgi:signal transduction histidine kinase
MVGFLIIHVSFIAVWFFFGLSQASMDSLVFLAITGTVAYLSVILRRHYPPIFFLIVCLVLLVELAFRDTPTSSWFLIPLAVHAVARWMPTISTRICLALALMLTSLATIRWMIANPDHRYEMLLIAITIGAVVVACYSAARRMSVVDEALVRQKLAETDAGHLKEAEQVARQRTIENQIRTSVARELHDVVAHSISVMVVQAEGGLAQVERSPATAQQALQTITDTGRESLQEMRRIVRTLRSDSPTNPEVVSSPQLSDISALVDKANATLTVSGTPRGSTPSIELTIYRVIQEALTNSLKHGGPTAEPHVAVLWFPTYVSVVVTNKLSGQPRMGDHRGTGLMGMSERVQALGGTLTTGPTGTGGFRVCAQIPLKTSLSPR